LLPLKDTIPAERTPVVTVVLIAATVVVAVLVQGHLWLLLAALSALFLAIFGPTVEDDTGHAAFVLLGAGAAGVTFALAGPDSDTAAGVVSAVLGAYVLLHRRARVVTVVLIPFLFTLVEVPALAVIALWFVLQAVLGALDLAIAGGFVLGLVAAGLLARPKRHIPAAYRV
jgi:membrane associated rhomboid family serine protease